MSKELGDKFKKLAVLIEILKMADGDTVLKLVESIQDGSLCLPDFETIVNAGCSQDWSSNRIG